MTLVDEVAWSFVLALHEGLPADEKPQTWESLGETRQRMARRGAKAAISAMACYKIVQKISGGS